MQSRFATGGSGAYQGSIDWFEWGTAGQAIPAAGTTRTNSRTIAGQILATTCVMGAPTGGALQAYRSGSFSGDGLDDMYNIGGTGAANQLVAGLSNSVAGATINFPVSCSATLSGSPVPLAGLVMADAEASSTTGGEYVQATIPAGAEWRVIDRFRAPASCTQSTPATRTGQQLRLGGTTGCATAYPTTVAFMEGATSATMEIHGGGVSAIALGVVLFSDFGDAPAGYGDAGSLYSPPFTGGVLAAGTTSIFAGTTTLGTPTQPGTRLGATVDSESASQPSATANADGADEDGVTPPASITVAGGDTYTLPNVACTGPGQVAGWIDWNRNGSFDSGERSATATCSGSSVSLSWTVPADVRSGSSFLRLRIGPDAASIAAPTGVTTAGEVEDYGLTVLAPADSGDAPDTLRTLLASNGPRNDVRGYDAPTHTAPLMLGARVDTDADGVPSSAADGDDNAGVDDEDALASIAVPLGETSTSITVPVTNTSGSPATLLGWIDADGDNAFEASEAASVTVASGATSVVLSWSGLSPAVAGTQPMVRLRLSSDTLTDNVGTTGEDERALGFASDGEVEDYRASVGNGVPLDCNTVYSIQGQSPRNLWSVNTGTGTQTSVNTFDITGATQNLNGLGISADGEKVYGILPNNTTTARSVYLLSRANGATSLLGAGVASAQVTHGAVNPATGFYYYGGMSGDTLNIYGFNTSTNTSIGRVAAGDISNGGANGDWAFDTQGHLYVVAGNSGDNVLSVVDQTLPTTTQATPLAISATEIATSTAAAAINGIAFSGDGFLYIASASVIYKINPSSGATVSQANLSASGSVDLASCSTPSTLEVRKDFPDGRSVATDQATLSISGGGLAAAVTATTAGTDTGVQGDPTETAGPVLALNGTTYTVSESGAGTVAASYTSSWTCVNSTSGITLASGTGTTGSVTVPAGTTTASVLCTFTNNLRKLDSGDAPASFGTTIAANGPRHVLVGYSSTSHTAPLMLGAQVDDETDGVPGAATTGDDSAGVDDEDALASLTLAPGATTASATVPVVNTSGAAATLYGWIDANGNGTFQAGEAATAAVPNGATSADAQLDRADRGRRRRPARGATAADLGDARGHRGHRGPRRAVAGRGSGRRGRGLAGDGGHHPSRRLLEPVRRDLRRRARPRLSCPPARPPTPSRRPVR